MKANPRVFISYSWTSPEYEREVLDLASRLRSNGVDVVLDKWDLKEGQDVHAFMESCVHDETISKVLVLSDRVYAEKANGRLGGVGKETQIISQQVYDDVAQEKFVGVVMERDQDGNPYLPTYIGSRFYIDLSNPESFEAEYERLLRSIFGRPLHEKPPLGAPPSYLLEESPAPSPTRYALQAYRDAVMKNRPQADGLFEDFMDSLVEAFEAERIPFEWNDQAPRPELIAAVETSLERFRPRRDELVQALHIALRYAPTDRVIEALHSRFGRMLGIRFGTTDDLSRPEGYSANLQFLLRELFLYTVASFIRSGRLDLLARFLAEPFHVPGRSGGALRGFAAMDTYIELLEQEYQRRGRVSADVDLMRARATVDELPFPRIMEADLLLAVRAVVADPQGGETWYPKTLGGWRSHGGPSDLFVRGQSPQMAPQLAAALGAESMDAVRARIEMADHLPNIHNFSGTAVTYLRALALLPPNVR